MPRYKLIYFNLRGRGETARYIFAYSGIKYEDCRIERADWPAIKPTVPFRKLPVLEADGVVIHQSLAISRYLARETGLAGETALEQAQADAIVDTINDFIVMFPWSEADKAVKQKLQDDLFTNVAPELLDHLENFLGDRLWFAGKSVTWADFYWTVCSTTFISMKQDFAQNHHKLLALKSRVEALPAIDAWIKERPKTIM
ncbi:hematopoietic prostaglandin D synthase [Latimeria chalumnae]|uniref:hematopoietic prostaglandin D synthase n=1 Tax=Latimeria chalumnae TaxID=7897 RepID=UPI00313C4E97